MELKEDEIQKLVLNAQNGNSDSAGQLFDILKNKIYRFFIYRVKDRETAEDLTQTAFLEMIRSLHRYKKKKNVKFLTWLFQIARFRLIDHYRSTKETVQIDAIVENTNQQLIVDPEPINMDSRSEKMWRAVAQLPEKHQTVLHLTYVQEMTNDEIAEVLNTTTLNIRVLKFRSLKKLKTLLRNNE